MPATIAAAPQGNSRVWGVEATFDGQVEMRGKPSTRTAAVPRTSPPSNAAGTEE
jgi:hypothetical protein